MVEYFEIIRSYRTYQTLALPLVSRMADTTSDTGEEHKDQEIHVWGDRW